jgi:dihydrodipicolinate synthase/N-acetylneuraminate lyase
VIGPFGAPAIKAAMDMLGLFGGAPRAPLLPADARLRAEIEQRLRAAELL